MAKMVLTVFGDDRAGLVDSLSEVIADHGGSWDKSYMAELAGKFAGVVAVTAPDTKVARLLAGLEPLRAGGLEITVHAVEEEAVTQPHRELSLQVSGHDHPGIIHDVSHALAERGISIAELSTEIREAPMGGGTLFEAHATLHAPEELSLAELLAAAEKLEDELAIHIELTAD